MTKMTMGASALLAAIVAYTIFDPTPATASVSPTISYTAEQVSVCQPVLLLDADSDAEKSSIGESVTATAVSSISADDGRFLDMRSGATVMDQGGRHLNRPGSIVVTQRVNNIFPTVAQVRSQAHRGRSFRTGRNAEAFNSIAGYQVLLTPDCIAALGFFD